MDTRENITMAWTRAVVVILMLVAARTPAVLHAQDAENTPQMPPAIVAVSEVSTSKVAPQSEFVGTVYYREVSEVASEVNGIVEEVSFEEGQSVAEGDILVRLGADLMFKTLEATRASHDQVTSDLEKERKDLERKEKLFRENLLSEQTYDEQKFSVQGLEKKLLSLRADVERIEIELQKKAIRAPYNGTVIMRHVDRGEWIASGSAVATIAADGFVDITAEVPESILAYLKQGQEVTVRSGGKVLKGKVLAVIPRGNITTRTFPVKVRARNTASLLEGMEARVLLPVDIQQETLTVPRDAVISMFGMNVVFAVIDAKAKMVPVEVSGYEGLRAGIRAEGLSAGMQVVVKGNERLRDGQNIIIQ